MSTPFRSLIFGGARSGKSRFAEQLAAQRSADGQQVIYLATARPGDAEMQVRIRHHQDSRPAAWRTVEQPLALAAALDEFARPGNVLLVDCLTLWLSNLLFSQAQPDAGPVSAPAQFSLQRELFLSALERARGDVILVSNEVGMGIVPTGAISRWFVDEAGRLNQAVAARCEQVVWVAAGLPLYLKQT